MSALAETLADVRTNHTMAYRLDGGYKMGSSRMSQARAVIDRYVFTTYLDVGCGRGEMLDYAGDYARVMGVEDVPDLCEEGRVIHAALPNLPFGAMSYEMVTCFDVMEHIPSQLAQASIFELGRIAEKYLVLTISNLDHLIGRWLWTW